MTSSPFSARKTSSLLQLAEAFPSSRPRQWPWSPLRASPFVCSMCSHRPLYPRSSPRDVDDIVVVVVVVVLSVVVASSLCATRTTTTRPPQRRRRGWRSNAIMQTFFVSFVPGATRPFRQKALLPSFCWATFSNVGVPSKLETIDRSSPFELLLQSKKQKSGKNKKQNKKNRSISRPFFPSL